MKRKLILLIPVMVLLSGCSLFRKKQVEEEPQQRSLITEPVNIIPVAQRPYITITPNQSGRNVTLAVEQLNKLATEAEFELEYTAGTLIQGAFGSFDLTEGSGEYEILLGSCSTGGTCSYHEDVKGGSATLSLSGDESYAVKLNWRYQASADADGAFGTQDQKFQISGEDLFADSAFVVTAETSGPPASVTGEIIAGPFGIFPSNGIDDSSEAEVTIRTNEEAAATVLGWDGSDWQVLEAEIDGKSVTVTGPVYQAYVVTK